MATDLQKYVQAAGGQKAGTSSPAPTKLDDYIEAATLSPNKQKIQQFNREQFFYDEDAKVANNPGGIIRQTIGGVGSTFANIGKGLYESVVKPDERQKKFEADFLPYGANDNQAAKFLTAPGVAAARVITRFVNPGLRPLADNIAEIRAINEKGGIADQIASGRIPASVLDDFAVLQKTAPQIVGDVAQAVLSAYAGGEGAAAAQAGTKLSVRQALTKGFGGGAGIGALFGSAQAASSGSTKPSEIINIIAQGGLGGGLLGAITTGAIPIAREFLPKIEEARALKLNVESQGGDTPVAINGKQPTVTADAPVAQTGLPRETPGFAPVNRPSIEKTTVITPTPEIATSKLSRDIADTLGKELGDLPEYKTMNMADQAAQSLQLIKDNPELAKSIAMGETPPPAGLREGSVFTAVREQAKAAGDTQTLIDLAHSNLATEASTLGQRIKAYDAFRDVNDPVRAIQDVISAREKQATKKGGDIIKVKEGVVKEIKQSIKKEAPTKQTWSEFIEKIKCNY